LNWDPKSRDIYRHVLILAILILAFVFNGTLWVVLIDAYIIDPILKGLPEFGVSFDASYLGWSVIFSPQ